MSHILKQANYCMCAVSYRTSYGCVSQKHWINKCNIFLQTNQCFVNILKSTLPSVLPALFCFGYSHAGVINICIIYRQQSHTGVLGTFVFINLPESPVHHKTLTCAVRAICSDTLNRPESFPTAKGRQSPQRKRAADMASRRHSNLLSQNLSWNSCCDLV